MGISNRLYYIHTLKRLISGHSFNGKSYVNKILNLLTPKAADNIIVKTKYKFKLKISPLFDKGIERAIFNKGVYEEGTLWCFKKILKKNYTVIDAGANIGLTAVFAGKLIGKKGKVYAFEPMPDTFDILCFNIKLNKLKNITAINYGLSDFEGKAEIYNNLHINRGAASLYSNKKENGISINITTLDNIVAQYGIANVDFIKIDIEGAEYPMLKGAENFLMGENRPMICLEFSRDVISNYNPELIYDFLKDTCEYRIFKQLRGKESQTSLIEVKNKMDLPTHDNLYCFKDYHFKLLPNELFINNIEV
ncbi:MAG: hypothetical protein CVU03_13650 [Bacteroidetes bacterium HGW-Bacteroidetes-2]|jgi:FkbM family methyltransferase|nr:MAG: hypothetical protein CVU03_13650 [Bacteroidetes bacterium HGW-Bacteroidetes-2]